MVSIVQICICQCTSISWQVGIAMPEAPVLCPGCRLERSKGFVLRCPTCKTISCGACVEKEMREKRDKKPQLKPLD